MPTSAARMASVEVVSVSKEMTPAEASSLTTEPASAPARLMEADGPEPVRRDEAETAEKSVQSARNEESDPIRVDGPAAAAVGGAADGSHDELLELVTSESRLVTTRMAKEIAGLRRDLEERAERIRRLSEALAEAQDSFWQLVFIKRVLERLRAGGDDRVRWDIESQLDDHQD